MARPSKLTDERREQIAELIRDGNYASQAAQASGISERTFYRWMEQGQELDDKCEAWDEVVERWNSLTDRQRRAQKDLEPDIALLPEAEEIELWQFWREVKKAEAEAETNAVELIKAAATDGSWQAAAWYLERKFKDRWSRQEKVSHEGSVAHNHQLLPTDSEKLEEARRRLEEARKAEAKQLSAPIEVEIVDEELAEQEEE